MNEPPSLEVVGKARSSDEPDPALLLRRAEDQIADIKGLMAEQLERERILEVEMAALRRDFDVKVAYCDALEKAAEERQGFLAWLQIHFDAENARAERAVAELAAERARLSYRVTRRIVAMSRRRRRG